MLLISFTAAVQDKAQYASAAKDALAKWISSVAAQQTPCAWMVVNLTQSDGKRLAIFGGNSIIDRVKSDFKCGERCVSRTCLSHALERR